MRTLSKEEVRQLLSVPDEQTATGARDKTIFTLLFDSGIRAAELTGLRLPDLHLGEGYLKVFGKGAKERVVPIGYQCQRALIRYIRRFRPEPALPSIDHVFLTLDGKPMQINWLYKIVSRACKKAGINGKRLGPHTLRHTFARNFLMNGGDLLTLQRILGHSSLDMVRRYVSLNTDDLVSKQRRFSPMDMLG
jgi:integrase/recombinase XerD